MRISSMQELRNSILFLEEKKRQQKKALHDQLENTYQSLKPINLLKSSLHSLFGISDQNSLLSDVVAIFGYAIAKKIIPGTPRNIIKRGLSASFGWALGRLVSRKKQS